MEWVAFEMLNDKDIRKKLQDEITLEISATKTAEQRAQEIINMFKLIGTRG